MTTASRVFTIQSLNTEFMIKDENKFIFYFNNVHKSRGKFRLPQPLPIMLLKMIRNPEYWKHSMELLHIQNQGENLMEKNNRF